MGDFAYLVCTHADILKDEPGKKRVGLVKAIKYKYFYRFILSEYIIEVKIFDDMFAYVIKLPHCPEQLRLNADGIEKQLSRFCLDKSIEGCITQPKVLERLHFDCCMPSGFDGHCLYRSLVMPILKRLSVNIRTDLLGMDIAIMASEESGYLLEIIRLLAPHIRYLTVVTRNRESIECKIDSIMLDTGLAVRITQDSARVIADAGCIINLDTSYNNMLRTKTGSVIINYSGAAILPLHENSTIVNSIRIDLPDSLKLLYDEISQCQGSCSEMELAETVLMHKIGTGKNFTSRDCGVAAIIPIADEFIELGCSIKMLVC